MGRGEFRHVSDQGRGWQLRSRADDFVHQGSESTGLQFREHRDQVRILEHVFVIVYIVLLQHLYVQNCVKHSCSEFGQLSHHHILRHAFQIVLLCKGSGFQQNIASLLESALHQGTDISPVDSVSGDGHRKPLECHHISQDREVPVVHIRPVERNDFPDLIEDGTCRDLHHMSDISSRNRLFPCAGRSGRA